MSKTKRIAGLDLIRFLSALGIISYHYFFIGVIQGFYSEEVFHPITFWGELGVDIFFIISGFVILYSAERRKSSSEFLKGRIIRIYPAFIICSIFTLITGIFMPGTTIKDFLFRWINSLTLCNDIWGVPPLSSIYWTLMVEMKFYILVAIIKKIKLWKKHKYHILFLWIWLSILNMFTFQWSWFEILFNSNYSGHFALGIVMYLFYKGHRDKWMPPICIGAIWLIYRNCISYITWIRSIYENLSYSDIDILFAVAVVIVLIFFSINVPMKDNDLYKIVPLLGSWSYTIYLIHADFGYFIRTSYYTRLTVWIPCLLEFVNEHLIMFFSIVLSLLVSYIVLLLTEKISIYLELFKETKKQV